MPSMTILETDMKTFVDGVWVDLEESPTLSPTPAMPTPRLQLAEVATSYHERIERAMNELKRAIGRAPAYERLGIIDRIKSEVRLWSLDCRNNSFGQ